MWRLTRFAVLSAGLGGGRVVDSDAVLKEPWTLIARTNATLIAFCIHLLSQVRPAA